MQVMLLIVGYPDGTGADDTSAFAEFLDYDRQLVEAGVKVHGSPFDDPDAAHSVHVPASGEPAVTRGRPTGADEYLGGFVLLDVPDLDTALDWAARCPGARYGRVDVRPLLGP